MVELAVMAIFTLFLGLSSLVTCSQKTSAAHSQRLDSRPGAIRTPTAKGSSGELRAFLLLRHEQRRGLSPGRRRTRHVPASVAYQQCKSWLIARRLLNNLKETWGRGLRMVSQQGGGNSGGCTCACVCSCVPPYFTNHVAYLHVHVSGFDHRRDEATPSSLYHDHFNAVMWGLFAHLVSASVHVRRAWHSLQRRSEFMDVLSHLIVTLMEDEGGNASP